MTKIAQGQTVRAETHSGNVKGQITAINNNKVTLQLESKTISENGHTMEMETDETITIIRHKITGVLE